MKYAAERPFAEPEKAARRLLEHAHAFEPIQDGRIYIEKLNALSCSATKARPRNIAPPKALLNEAGWKFMTAEHLLSSHRQALICSPSLILRRIALQ
jgi:hypothetical protein